MRTQIEERLAVNGSSHREVSWQRLARANTHPLRISILEVLGLDGGRVLSPSDLSYELRTPLSNINYHTIELHKSGLLELVRTRPVRGATEHFYRLADDPAEANGNGNGARNGHANGAG
ncbi:MAG TPA: helix-turn-helix domain-containing protein [Solirubrobacterales bacterium]|nr:helix-turn-helix domain-containing protein [Solirubrobacterales bacterium]